MDILGMEESIALRRRHELRCAAVRTLRRELYVPVRRARELYESLAAMGKDRQLPTVVLFHPDLEELPAILLEAAAVMNAAEGLMALGEKAQVAAMTKDHTSGINVWLDFAPATDIEVFEVICWGDLNVGHRWSGETTGMPPS